MSDEQDDRARRTASNSTTTDGMPARPGFEDQPAPAPTGTDGQHAAYWVLSPEERAKGFVRPVRRAYKHVETALVNSTPLRTLRL